MVSLSSAEEALKTVYLGVISEQLNLGINPLLAKIKQSTDDVWGKEVRKLVNLGINGGIGAGTETGELPIAAANRYITLKLLLKNLYGRIEISDKALRASSNNAGAFVNLLNAEMEGLLKASSFNFGRMLYGDGTGVLTKVVSVTGAAVTVESCINCIEGMVIDFIDDDDGKIISVSGVRITAIDRSTNTLMFGRPITGVAPGTIITLQNSENNELTGLGAIFKETGFLYGLNRSQHRWLQTHLKSTVGELTDIKIQTIIDKIDEDCGSEVDFIVCSYGVKRAYQQYLSSFKKNIDVMNLEGGHKAISFNGIPLIADRFVGSGQMYLLNTKEFSLCQLCDWSWLEGDNGRIISQIGGRPVYSATLVKYADILCANPRGQAKLTGITEG